MKVRAVFRNIWELFSREETFADARLLISEVSISVRSTFVIGIDSKKY